jgi:hypothetical protein
MAKNFKAKPIAKKTESTQNPLTVRVPADKAFWLKSDHGQIVAVCHSIKELADKVEKAPDSVFKFHTRGGNDFARWIKDVFKNNALSQKVSKATNKKQFVILLRG